MSIDPTQTKNPVQAAALLAELESKDPNECSYPGCHQPRQVTIGTGRPSTYCSNQQHNAVNAHRVRQRLMAVVSAWETTNTQVVKPGSSPTASANVSAESLRGSVLSRIQLLQADLERYVATLTEMSDPEISAAQIQAVLDQANARVADMQQALSNEQALRLKAEKDLLVVQKQAQNERDAAEQAIQRMEEVEAEAQEQLRQAEARIIDIQTERDATIERERLESQQRIQDIQMQANNALREARNETAKAQEEGRLAHAAALEARTQATTAERLIKEAQSSLERERAEIDRLRKELEEVRTRAQVDLEQERRRAQADRDRERADMDRLREEVMAARKLVEQVTTRADTLATTNDQLRAQLLQQHQ